MEQGPRILVAVERASLWHASEFARDCRLQLTNDVLRFSQAPQRDALLHISQLLRAVEDGL
jgi:hypothetical protein